MINPLRTPVMEPITTADFRDAEASKAFAAGSAVGSLAPAVGRGPVAEGLRRSVLHFQPN